MCGTELGAWYHVFMDTKPGVILKSKRDGQHYVRVTNEYLEGFVCCLETGEVMHVLKIFKFEVKFSEKFGTLFEQSELPECVASAA